MEFMVIGRREDTLRHFSMLDKRTNQKDYTENELQMGIAPYLGEYNQLHTWIMLKSKEDTRDSKWKTYPFIKLFKGTFIGSW